jgi:hypothetical protein
LTKDCSFLILVQVQVQVQSMNDAPLLQLSAFSCFAGAE